MNKNKYENMSIEELEELSITQFEEAFSALLEYKQAMNALAEKRPKRLKDGGEYCGNWANQLFLCNIESRSAKLADEACRKLLEIIGV
jgi:hypothetical protein